MFIFLEEKIRFFFVFYILSFFREKELPCCFLVRKFDQIVASLQLEGKKMYLYYKRFEQIISGYVRLGY